MNFEDELCRTRKQSAMLDQMISSDHVGPALVRELVSLIATQRTFLQRWGNINGPDSLSPLTALAARLAKDDRRRDVLFLLNLLMMIEVRRVLHLIGVNDEFTFMAKSTDERESSGQLSLACVHTNPYSESQAVLEEAQKDYDRGLRQLTANWPEKVNLEFPDRLEFFDPSDCLDWNVEIRGQLVRLCLDSDFPVKERTIALRIINRL